MGPVMVYLGLGSNLGDREANLRHALELLSGDITLEKDFISLRHRPLGL